MVYDDDDDDDDDDNDDDNNNNNNNISLKIVTITKFWILIGSARAYLSHTVFTRISAAALIKFFAPQAWRLIEGGAYSRAMLI